MCETNLSPDVDVDWVFQSNCCLICCRRYGWDTEREAGLWNVEKQPMIRTFHLYSWKMDSTLSSEFLSNIGQVTNSSEAVTQSGLPIMGCLPWISATCENWTPHSPRNNLETATHCHFLCGRHNKHFRVSSIQKETSPSISSVASKNSDGGFSP